MEPRSSLTDSDCAANTDEALLWARDLGLYDQGRWLWRKLDLAVAPGERVALTGPSGSGKTTLLRALAGLLPVTCGEVFLDNREMRHWSMPQFRSRVGYLPQQPVLNDGETVQAVLTAPFDYQAHRQHRYPREQIRDQLRVLGRDDTFLERRVESLSGGEQQIAALLRLLALQPALLLLDEPTASLDREASRGVEALLNAWRDQDSGHAWLWVGHDPEQSARMSDRHLELRWNP